MSWVVGGAGTFALSLISAYWFLRMRCRGIGPPFGPRARYWATFIVVGTAIVSTGVGLLILAASHDTGAAYAGIVVPGGLGLGRLPPQRDREMLPRTLSALLTLPFSRLYDRMGDDMEDWCTTRLAAAAKPRWVSDAVTYYHTQVAGRIRDAQARAELEGLRASITHKISLVELINGDADPARVRAALALHSSTQNRRKYSDNDPPLLARRLEADARNELGLFLKLVYRQGYHKLLIYPFRPTVEEVRAQRARPVAPDV